MLPWSLRCHVLARWAWTSSGLCCKSGLGRLHLLRKVESHERLDQFSSVFLFLLFKTCWRAYIWPGTCSLSVRTFTFFASVSVTRISGGWPFCPCLPCCVVTTGGGSVTALAGVKGEDGKSQVWAANTPLHVCISMKLGCFTCVSHKEHK